MPSSSKAVQPVEAATPVRATVVDGLSSKTVLDYLVDPDSVDISVFEVEDPDAIAARITAEQIDATSAETLFGPPDVWHAEDVLGKPLTFISVTWLPSSVEGDGLPIFGVFKVADASGETHVLTCGAKSVVLKLAKADYEGWLPRRLKLVQAEKTTGSGRLPYDLIDAPEGF